MINNGLIAAVCRRPNHPLTGQIKLLLMVFSDRTICRSKKLAILKITVLAPFILSWFLKFGKGNKIQRVFQLWHFYHGTYWHLN